MGWKLHSGEPNKMRAARCIKTLERAKLITIARDGRFQITAKGKKALKGETEEE
jgi:hypothetical protein